MQTYTLNGTWQLSAGHRSLESVDMQIPGTVLSGLLAAGKIKDPFYRTNEDATRALFWKDYVFTRTFDVDEELLAQQHIVLVCEGLDTLAEISINGTFLAKTDNMHRTWKFQAKKLLHPGKNEIQIVFRSVLRFIEDYPYEAHKKINYIPCGSMKGNQLCAKHTPCLAGTGVHRPSMPEFSGTFIYRDIPMPESKTSASISSMPKTFPSRHP